MNAMASKIPCCAPIRGIASELPFVLCQLHGSQSAALVCQHLAQSLDDGRTRGFQVDGDIGLGGGHPDAWCRDCAAQVAAAGGEWTDEVMDFVRVLPICVQCYVLVRTLNDT